MTLILIFMAVLEALKWLSIVACIAVLFWFTGHRHLRQVAQGLIVGAVMGIIMLLPEPVITMNLQATMPAKLFSYELYLLICCTGVCFVPVKNQLENKLRTIPYSQE